MSILCKKCLIGQDAENYEALIAKNRAAISPRELADEDTRRRRIALCEECSYLSGPTCLACGCYVELRSLKKGARCPYKKW